MTCSVKAAARNVDPLPTLKAALQPVLVLVQTAISLKVLVLVCARLVTNHQTTALMLTLQKTAKK